MKRQLLPALLCICATSAFAQPVLANAAGARPDEHELRKAGLRKDLKLGQAEAASNQPRDAARLPANPKLSPGEHAELRQQLRQQQIEAIKLRP